MGIEENLLKNKKFFVVNKSILTNVPLAQMLRTDQRALHFDECMWRKGRIRTL
jgi:hypothetical protein